MATKRRLACRPCGGYRVRLTGTRVVVDCQSCGEAAGEFTPAAARRLADRLEGPLARFQTPAPAAERLRLAIALRRAAGELQAHLTNHAAFRRRLERARAAAEARS